MLRLRTNTGKLTYWFLLCMMLPELTACSTWGFMDKYPRHSFSFDTQQDSPDAEVLDYQYGTIRQLGTYANRERVAMMQTFPAANTSGKMLRGDFLSVKWRIIKNPLKLEYLGYYEDKVDLRKRLPADITGFGIHFAVKGHQLFIYLIPPPGTWPAGALRQPIDERTSAYLKQHQIYPDQPNSSNK